MDKKMISNENRYTAQQDLKKSLQKSAQRCGNCFEDFEFCVERKKKQFSTMKEKCFIFYRFLEILPFKNFCWAAYDVLFDIIF